VIEESLSLQKKEIDMIRKALDKYNGKEKMLPGNSEFLKEHYTGNQRI